MEINELAALQAEAESLAKRTSEVAARIELLKSAASDEKAALVIAIHDLIAGKPPEETRVGPDGRFTAHSGVSGPEGAPFVHVKQEGNRVHICARGAYPSVNHNHAEQYSEIIRAGESYTEATLRALRHCRWQCDVAISSYIETYTAQAKYLDGVIARIEASSGLG